MGGSPVYVLLLVSMALITGSSAWRRRKIRRAVRDLPTLMQRQLGEAPLYEPPESAPEGLEGYVRLYHRLARIEKSIWILAALWLAYVLILATRGI